MSYKTLGFKATLSDLQIGNRLVLKLARPRDEDFRVLSFDNAACISVPFVILEGLVVTWKDFRNFRTLNQRSKRVRILQY